MSDTPELTQAEQEVVKEAVFKYADVEPMGLPSVLIYGPPKAGKTWDAARCYHDEALYLCEAADALQCAVTMGGFRPRFVRNSPTLIDTVTWLAKYLKQINDMRDEGKPVPIKAVVVEDISLQAEAALLTWRGQAVAEARKKEQKYNKAVGTYAPDQHHQWARLQEYLLRTRSLLRAIKLPYIITGHKRDPYTDDDGVFYRGGPLLPSRNRTEEIPSVCSTVLRAARDTGRPGPWKYAYVCDPADPNYVTGDRNNLAPREGPMNVGELLRANGYALPRMPGLEWQDEVAEAIVAAAADDPDPFKAAKAVAPTWAARGLDPRHLRWALQDGMARVEYRRIQDNPLADFGVGDAPNNDFGLF